MESEKERDFLKAMMGKYSHSKMAVKCINCNKHIKYLEKLSKS